jgi:subtilisin family serine protease
LDRCTIITGIKIAPVSAALVLSASLLLAACGGGGGGSTPSVPITPTPVATNTGTLPATSAVSVSAGTAASTATFATITGGYGGSVTLPGTSSSGSAALVLSTTTTGPALAASSRLPKSIGGILNAIEYISLTPSATLTFSSWPTFTFVLPSGSSVASGGSLYLAYNPGNTASGWTTLAGPAAVNGTTVTFTPSTTIASTFTSGTVYEFALLSTAEFLTPSAAPSSTATAAPTAVSTTSTVANAYVCPTSANAVNSVARVEASGDGPRRRARLRPSAAQRASGTTFLAVSYDRSSAQSNSVQIASRERQSGVTLIHSYDFASTGTAMHVVSVPTSSVAQAEASLRSQSGVTGVALTGERRFRSTTTALYTNDPYFQGFGPYTQQAAPYAESASIPGQWDMQAIGLEYAYGYSQPGTTYTANSAALGSSAIKIAIIDTGEDASHPELSGKIAYQRCFITDVAGTSQSTGNFSTDLDGHGTDVSGIAAAAAGNGVGFTGAGGNSTIYAYRVFPTPDDSCAGDGGDLTCSSSTDDIAAAINDAVAQHVNIISMSLGGGNCNNGVDTDPVEGTAIQNAIKAGVIVVAASGNSGTSGVGVDAPGCNTGVIAVGATGLADGQATGSSTFTSTRAASASAINLVEYVAQYSQWGTPSSSVHSSSAWGIVAPGGDPSTAEGAANTPVDELHWIENIWTSTPYLSSSVDQNFLGNCSPDFRSTNGTSDCRTLIAGTSMATPHVAGAAALILAVNPSYGTPSAMKALLCSTADDISDTHQGCGRLNVYRAMAKAMNDTSPP